MGTACPSGESAQRKLLSTLREARQDRPHPAEWRGRHGWGQSRWPEADAIRIKAGGGFRHDPEQKNADQYPRAALGLPIVIHYKPPNEPEDYQVRGAVPGEKGWLPLERYSSPLLLRPVRVWRGNQAEYIPVALFTDCTLPANARPWVASNGANQNGPRTRDVAAGYSILDKAAETLARIESVFSRAGYRRLTEAP